MKTEIKVAIVLAIVGIALYTFLTVSFNVIQKASKESARASEAQVDQVLTAFNQ